MSLNYATLTGTDAPPVRIFFDDRLAAERERVATRMRSWVSENQHAIASLARPVLHCPELEYAHVQGIMVRWPAPDSLNERRACLRCRRPIGEARFYELPQGLVHVGCGP